MIKHVRPAVIMMIFSATRKESGSLMIIAATNGSQKRRYIGVTACCSDSLERGEMMEKTYEEVEKTADSLQAAATRKKNLEVAKINSFLRWLHPGNRRPAPEHSPGERRWA